MKVARITIGLLMIPMACALMWTARLASAQTATDKANQGTVPLRNSALPKQPDGGNFFAYPQSNHSVDYWALGIPVGADAEMAKLHNEEASAERQVKKLVDAYAYTEDQAKRAELKKTLADTLANSFDLQQKRRSLELARVEERLKKVRDVMQKRSDARQTIIDKRLDQVLREADGLGWTSPPGLNLSSGSRSGYNPLTVLPPSGPVPLITQPQAR